MMITMMIKSFDDKMSAYRLGSLASILKNGAYLAFILKNSAY